MRVIIDRLNHKEKQTEGLLTVLDDEDNVLFRCYTLELPWLKNAKRVSCIPSGEYDVTKRSSTKYKEHFHVLNVPNRTYILIHNGNYNWHTKGCILVGRYLKDINKDGLRDVTYSRQTMAKLNKLLPSEFKLKINN